MLSAVVEVLVFLHINKLTHGHIKPSNILAIGDRLKVSSDTIEPLVEAREMRRKRDVYDAPEVPATAYTPAADIWSLGVTLVETLTQQPAFLPFNENAEPVIAPAIREPLREIATNALRRDPKARWTALDIASKLNPEAAEKLKAALAAAQVKSAPAVAATTPVAVSATAAAVIGAPVGDRSSCRAGDRFGFRGGYFSHTCPVSGPGFALSRAALQGAPDSTGKTAHGENHTGASDDASAARRAP